MEVWVAGATGVLGRHTVPLLLQAGHSVVGLARSPEKWPNHPPEMRLVACDITQSGQVIKAFAGQQPDAVLHLATAIPPGKPVAKDWERNDAIRRAGTENLTEAALLADAYYVQQSVHYVYHPQGDNWITEEAPFERVSLITSAIDAERITHKAFNRGLRGSVIRPSTLYTAESGQTQALLHGLKSGMPVVVGNGQNFWSFVHPDDVGSAILRLLETMPLSETYNLTDDEPVRMKDCLTWVAQQIHAHPPRSTPAFMAKLLLGGDMVDLLIGSRRVANRKAREELGWQLKYPTFREGFPAEIARMKPRQPAA